MTIQMKYCCLREDFLSVTQPHIDESILRIFKEYYADCIDSNRKLSEIKDLRTLLKILEKRDTLGYNNVEPLIHISNYLNNPQVQKKIQDYKVYLENIQYSPFCDMYQQTNGSLREHDETEIKDSASKSKVQNVGSEYQSVSHGHVRNPTGHSEQEAMLQQMVLSQISERIGRSWRDTARFLGIPEYQIDVIQNKYPFDLKEQSYEALKLCISQYSTGDWKLSLLYALEKARRRDLKELVEKLLIHTRIE